MAAKQDSLDPQTRDLVRFAAAIAQGYEPELRERVGPLRSSQVPGAVGRGAAAPVGADGRVSARAHRLRRVAQVQRRAGAADGRGAGLRPGRRVDPAGRGDLRHGLRRELPQAPRQRPHAASRHRRVDDHRGLRPHARPPRARPHAARALHGGPDGGAGGAASSSTRTSAARSTPAPRSGRSTGCSRSSIRCSRSTSGRRSRSSGARCARAGRRGTDVHRSRGGAGGGGHRRLRGQLVRPLQVQAQGRARRRRRRPRRQRVRRGPTPTSPRCSTTATAPSGRPSAAEHGKGKTKTGASTDDLYLPVPPGTVVRDADTGELLGEVLRAGDTAPGRARRPRRPGQRPLRHAHPPGAARVGARRGRAGAADRAGAQAHRRRRPGGRAQRRQEHAALGPLGRAAQDRRLSVHHARAQPRRRPALRPPHVRAGRHSRHHRGRARGQGARAQVPAARRAHPGAGVPGAARQSGPAGQRTSGCGTRCVATARRWPTRRTSWCSPSATCCRPTRSAAGGPGARRGRRARDLERRRHRTRGAQGIPLEVRRAGSRPAEAELDAGGERGRRRRATGSSWTTNR